MFREPLILPLAAFAGGIVLSQATQFYPFELAAAAGVLACLAAAARWRRSRWLALTSAAAAMLCAGALADVLHRPGPPPEIEGAEGEVLVLAGCVVSPPALSVDREQFTLELEPGARVNVSLSLKNGEQPPHLQYGERIEFDARVRRPHNFRNPGAFDYVRYLARKQVYWTATARASAPIRTLEGRCGSPIAAAVFRMRVAAIERIEQLYSGDDYATGMMEAVLIGETSKLEKVWTDHFRRTGTYHTIVIAGMHIIMLAGTVLMLLRVCQVQELPALAITAVVAWLYAAICGGAPPVLRAASGFTLYLVARWLWRRGRVLNVLAAVALVYLACDPEALFEAAFQLSFLCVAAIGAFSAPLTDFVLRRYRPAGRKLSDPTREFRCAPTAAEFRVELRLLAETIAFRTRIPQRYVLYVFQAGVRIAGWALELAILSAVVQIALALPMALYFHRISITGLTANLIVTPLMNLLVPVGFAAILSGWHPVAEVARWLLMGSRWAASWHVRLEPSHRVPDPPVWLILSLVAALIVLAIAIRFRSRWTYGSVAVALGLFGLMVAAPFQAEVPQGVLELIAVDVGQGDGLVLTTPRGKVLLIDAGGFPSFGRKKKSNLDIGEDVISPYLWTRRIQHADAIATTHAHADHVGGLKALIENFRPAEVWTGALPNPNIESDALEQARSQGARVIARHAGESFDFGGARFEVLAPAADHVSNGRSINNDSLVVRVRYGKHSFLLTGDVERQVEWDLAAQGVLDQTTVLKVAHHGSKTSSTPEFLDATRPGFAIISVGNGNTFRHPHPDVVERLGRYHADVLRTDEQGMIAIRTDGMHLSVRTIGSGNGGFAEPFQSW